MKKLIFFFLFLVFNGYAQFNFERNWGTYLGDERFVFADSKVDRDGNLYIVGYINGNDLTNILSFTDATSHQPNYGGGETDGFIIKLNPSGAIVWGTFFGGQNDDAITAIDIDMNSGNFYLLGTTSSTTNIATTGSFQALYGGGIRDAFISKFSSTGSLEWSTYYGGTSQDGDSSTRAQQSSISYDGNNSIYVVFPIASEGLATNGAFQSGLFPDNMTVGTNATPAHLVKFDTDGNRIWSTYYGIYWSFMIKANANGVYLFWNSQDCPPSGTYNTYYGTAGAYQAIPASCRDVVLTKFGTDGQRVWSTYYGGSNNGDTATGKNSIDLIDDKIYFTGNSANYTNQEIATTGSYMTNVTGTSSNFIVQFNDDCTRNFGTYNGSTIVNNAAGHTSNVVVGEKIDSFYNYGATGYTQNITTTDGYKSQLSGTGKDAFVCKFDNQSEKNWGTYYGGELDEIDAQFHYYANGTKFYIIGKTQSYTQIASVNGLQPNKQVFDSENPQNEYNLFVAHFQVQELSNEVFNRNDFSIYPNPSSNGTFFIMFDSELPENTYLELFDISGKKIHEQQLEEMQNTITLQNIVKGMYFAKITKNGQTVSSKIIID
jgi:hypothetical protein